MRQFRRKFIILMLVGLASALFAQYPITNDGKSPFVQVVKDTRKSVVNIRVEGEEKTNYRQQLPFDDDIFKFFFPQLPQSRKFIGMGSGFIFKRQKNDVYIMTNNHVVEKGKEGEITVTLADKAKYDAEIVGLDPMTDLAVIKITVDDNEEVVLSKFGDSEALDVGEWVIAIGNPFGELGLERTVTVGVVSAKHRSNLNFGNKSPVYQDYIQTDAAINPGNSGGPLVNLKGEVIGVNAAITSPAGGNVGIGFAIPSEIAQNVAEKIIKHGKVTRAYLGILPQSLNSELAKGLGLDKVEGVLVAKVEKDTPAEKAGFERQDVIIEFNGEKITNVSQFRLAVANSNVGEKAKIKVIRDGKEKMLTAKLEAYPDDDDSSINSSDDNDETLDIEVEELDSDFANRLRIDEDYGVVVSGLDKNGKASEAGLSVGDVILEVNKEQINSKKDFYKAIKQARKEKQNIVLFYVKKLRGGYAFIPIKVK